MTLLILGCIASVIIAWVLGAAIIIASIRKPDGADVSFAVFFGFILALVWPLALFALMITGLAMLLARQIRRQP